MDVAILTPVLLDRDGVGRSTRTKARLLVERGHDVTLYVERPELSQLEGFPGAILPLTVREAIADSLDRRDEGFLRHQIYLYEYPTYYGLVETVRVLEGKHVLFDCYGVTPPRFFDRAEDRRFIHRSLQSLSLLELAHRVVVHSDFSGREARELTGLPKERFAVVPLALDPACLEPASRAERDRWRARLGWEGEHVLLYVGRAAGNKGLSTLVDALVRLVPQVPGAVLHLVGDSGTRGHERVRDQVLAQARRLGVAERVRFEGTVDEAGLAGRYAAADLLATASEHEGFCYPVAEAMARGLPVVCSDAAALPDTAGGAACLFPAGDAGALAREVVRLARDPEHRAATVRAGLARAASFRPEAVGRRLEEVLLETLRLPPRPIGKAGELVGLAARLEVGYRDRSSRPWIGTAVSWLRRKFTWHLERFYVRELERNFHLFSLLAATEMAELRRRVEELTVEVEALSRTREGPSRLSGHVEELRERTALANRNHRARIEELWRTADRDGDRHHREELDVASYDALLAKLPLRRFARALELGSGDGRGLESLAALAGSVVGMDLDPARGSRPSGSLLVRGRLEELPFRDASFDLIVSRHVMEHSAAPRLVLREVRRLLAPGGCVAAITPHFFPDTEPAHVSVMTAEQWRRVYEEAGFDVLHLALQDLAVAECCLVATR